MLTFGGTATAILHALMQCRYWLSLIIWKIISPHEFIKANFHVYISRSSYLNEFRVIANSKSEMKAIRFELNLKFTHDVEG